jgi:FHS family glucose/mannose:H+ symporter-like MFS transporter
VTAAQRLLALAGILMFAFLGAIQALYGPLLPEFQRAFAIDSSRVGLIFVSHGLGALLGIFVPSMIRVSAATRRWLSVGTVLLLLGAGAVTLAPTWPTILAAVFVLAIGFGIHVIRLNSLFIAGFGTRAMAMTQLLNAAFSIGCILGPLALGLIGTPSQSLFGAITVGALLLLPICALTDRSVPSGAHTESGAAEAVPSAAGTTVLLIGFVALMSLIVGVENSIAGWTATLALADGYSYATAANLTAVFFGCIFAGRLLAAAVSHRFRPDALVLGAIVCVALCLSIAVFSRASPIVFAATGFAIAPLFAGTLVWLGARLPTLRHANAVVIGGALIGSATFPALVGRIIGRFGVTAATPAVLCIALAAAAVAASIYVLRRQ